MAASSSLFADKMGLFYVCSPPPTCFVWSLMSVRSDSVMVYTARKVDPNVLLIQQLLLPNGKQKIKLLALVTLTVYGSDRPRS